MIPEQTNKDDGRIVLKYRMGPKSLLSVNDFAKSIRAFASLLTHIAKDVGAGKVDVLITDLACFEEDGQMCYAIEVQPVPKGAVILSSHYEENVPGKYLDKQ